MDEVTLEARERAKYEKVWEFDQYRLTAPGEEAVDAFLEAVRPPAGTTVLDLGCGTGRPAARLAAEGLDVTGVDFATNCLDPRLRAHVRLVLACLWGLPPGLEGDWGFCTDVMEHIPPEKVRDTLTCIAGATRLGCFFQIATKPDRLGPRHPLLHHLPGRGGPCLMSRGLSSGMGTEVAKTGGDVIQPALLWKGELDGGDLNLWTGLGEIDWNGDTYSGAGNLFEVGRVRETLSLRANGMTFGLNGLDSDLISTALATPYQGRVCTLWLGAISSGSLIADPKAIFVGFLDVMQIVEQPDRGTATIRVSAEGRLIALERPIERRWTPEDQKLLYSGDTFFDYVAGLQDKEIVLNP